MSSVWTKCFSFMLKFFKMMGKALSDKLSCTGTDLVFITPGPVVQK